MKCHNGIKFMQIMNITYKYPITVYLSAMNEHNNPADGSGEDSSLPQKGISRRHFLRNIGLAGAGYTLLPFQINSRANEEAQDNPLSPKQEEKMEVELTINKKRHKFYSDTRSTLLDTLRESLHLTGTKKGCDHGQCGACTVLFNGRRVNSCLLLTGMCDGGEVTTIEGLAEGADLHPMQAAFIKHDAFQCGYCTPGQICSAVGLVDEGHAQNTEDIKELMSGNICRCGAYQHITDAISEVINS